MVLPIEQRDVAIELSKPVTVTMTNLLNLTHITGGPRGTADLKRPVTVRSEVLVPNCCDWLDRNQNFVQIGRPNKLSFSQSRSRSSQKSSRNSVRL